MTGETKKTRKSLAILLALALFMGICTVFAKPAAALSGEGSEEKPYLISSVEDFVALRNDVNGGNDYAGKYFKMTNDIDFASYLSPTGAGYDGGAGWLPIGKSFKTFAGHFDGGNFAVKNLFINRTDANMGLFGSVENGSIKNVNVVDCSIKGGERTGGVVGIVDSNFKLENCSASGTVIGTSTVGGIAGVSYSAVENCRNTAKVSGNQYVGGICGRGDGGISNSSNAGEVTSTGSSSMVAGTTGGIAGQAVDISYCYNTGAVNGIQNYTGGIVGEQKGNVSFCFNTGSITGDSGVGGIAGDNSKYEISYCYNTGTIAATASYNGTVGGICGSSSRDPIAIKFCYSAAKVTIASTNGSIGGIIGDNGGSIDLVSCYFNSDLCKEKRYTPAGEGLNTEEMLTQEFAVRMGEEYLKRPDDGEKSYYPELKCFYNSTDSKIAADSKASTGVEKPQIAAITAPEAVKDGGELVLDVPAVTSDAYPITAQGWQLSADGTAWDSFDPAEAVALSQNGYQLRYFATSAAGTSYSNPVSITVTRAVVIHADPGDCAVTGVQKQYSVKDTVNFTAAGSGEIADPIEGDERYMPISWEDGENRDTWNKGPYTGTYQTGKAGDYTLKVTFALCRYSQNNWVYTEETAIVTTAYTVTPAVVPDDPVNPVDPVVVKPAVDGTPTGDTTNFVAVVTLLLSGALLVVTVQKKREIGR